MTSVRTGAIDVIDRVGAAIVNGSFARREVPKRHGNESTSDARPRRGSIGGNEIEALASRNSIIGRVTPE